MNADQLATVELVPKEVCLWRLTLPYIQNPEIRMWESKWQVPDQTYINMPSPTYCMLTRYPYEANLATTYLNTVKEVIRLSLYNHQQSDNFFQTISFLIHRVSLSFHYEETPSNIMPYLMTFSIFYRLCEEDVRLAWMYSNMDEAEKFESINRLSMPESRAKLFKMVKQIKKLCGFHNPLFVQPKQYTLNKGATSIYSKQYIPIPIHPRRTK